MELTSQVGQRKVSPEATFRCGFAVRCSKSFRLCRNMKTKDSFPEFVPSRTGGAAELCTHPALPYPVLQQQT